MPELPDVTVYVERLAALLLGRSVEEVRLASPFLVRTVDPPLPSVRGAGVQSVERLGKRIVLGLDGDRYLVLHLMIAGRLHWKKRGSGIPGRGGLFALDFEHGTLLLTEFAKQKRASLHLVRGREGLAAFHRSGVEVLDGTEEAFARALCRERHTLKRALTDPDVVSGVGNAYSDEILHRARLSPVRWTTSLDAEEIGRLWQSARAVLVEWTERLRNEVGAGFPENVTAFRPEMAVHGRFRQPCPVCGTAVQRIVYADRETNYCPRCQTDGKLLADRALSQLLKADWPKTIDELEAKRSR